MDFWDYCLVPFKYQFSDILIWKTKLPLYVHNIKLQQKVDGNIGLADFRIDSFDGQKCSQGFLIRGMPLSEDYSSISRYSRFICYCPYQYQHYYIDLRSSFEQYCSKFSGKTKNTIKRKINKFKATCGGLLDVRVYESPSEMKDFFKFAREVSSKTYQERLLNAGLPSDEKFIKSVEEKAAFQRIRAYILFHNGEPASYLFCPIEDNIVVYGFLGYDPNYFNLSAGTILQWTALELIFKEGRFKFFDFTEGQSDHKRLFSTDHRQCGNLFFLKDSIANRFLVYSHFTANKFSGFVGRLLEKFGLKKKVKRLFRFSAPFSFKQK